MRVRDRVGGYASREKERRQRGADDKRGDMYEFIGCAASNFCKGRPFGFRPEAIVLHIMDSDLADGEALFRNPASCKSAHYGVSREGEVHQYVDENDAAFHAGIVVNPTWELLKPRVNPNFYTIGIAHEGLANQPCTKDQLWASAQLIGEIVQRWNIALDNRHIIGHQQIRASRECPGTSLVISELLKRVAARPVKAAAAVVGGPPIEKEAPAAISIQPAIPSGEAAVTQIAIASNGREELAGGVQPNTATASANGDQCATQATAITGPFLVRTLRSVKLRKAKPAVTAPPVRVIPAFTDIVVARFEMGDPLEGNAYWYVDVQDNYFWAGATNVPDPTMLAKTAGATPKP